LYLVIKGMNIVNWQTKVGKKQNTQEQLSRKYTPEKVLDDSPVREDNFAKIIDGLKEKLPEEQQKLLDAVYNKSTKDVEAELKKFQGQSLDFLSEQIKGLNLIHVAAARPLTGKNPVQETNGIISKLVLAGVDKNSLAEFLVASNGKEEKLRLSPIFFTNKTFDEDPKSSSKNIMNYLLDVELAKNGKIALNKVKKSREFGVGFSNIVNEMASSGRFDLYTELKEKGYIDPSDSDHQGLDLQEFLRDNLPYFQNIHTPEKIKQSYEKFRNIKNKSSGKKTTSTDVEQYIEQANKGVFLIHPKNNPNSVLYNLTFVAGNDLEKTDNKLPDNAICSLLFSDSEFAEVIKLDEDIMCFLRKAFSTSRSMREKSELSAAIKNLFSADEGDFEIHDFHEYSRNKISAKLRELYPDEKDKFAKFLEELKNNIEDKELLKNIVNYKSMIYQNDEKLYFCAAPDERDKMQTLVNTLNFAGRLAQECQPIDQDMFLNLCAKASPIIEPYVKGRSDAQDALKTLAAERILSPSKLFNNKYIRYVHQIKEQDPAEFLQRNNREFSDVPVQEISLWKQLLNPETLQTIYDYAGPRGKDTLYDMLSFAPNLELRNIVTPVSDSPKLIIIGGASTSGKSVLTKQLQGVSRQKLPIEQQVARDSLRITPKDVIFALKKDGIEIKGDGRHPEKLSENKSAYYRKLNELVENYLSQGKSLVLDEHCDEPEEIKNILNTAKQVSPKITPSLIGITVDPDSIHDFLNKAEIVNYKGDVVDGKQNDYDFIMKTAKDFQENFDQYKSMFDLTILYQNSVDKKAAKPIASWINSNNQVSENIHDQVAYNAFIDGKSGYSIK